MNKQYSCGCCFKQNGNSIELDLSLDNLNLECKKAWDIIGTGNTKGCFQLESRLGQTMAKKLKPENIEQLAALISILRPGCLEAYRDNKNISNHYIDRKNGLENIDHYHDSLKDILGTTYGEMIYQEQAMQISQAVAGFDLQDADVLRKAIGKKKPEEMAKIKKKFLKGCKKLGKVEEEQAVEIFKWIEKSQRYSFNKSHAVSYAMNAYMSAYVKAHFTKRFFVSYLRLAKEKIDPFLEISDLINNCRQMNIDVCGPDFRLDNQTFILKDGKIFFGLTDIKGVGDSVYKKMQKIKIDKQNANYLEILFKVLVNTNKTASKAMISVGCFDYLNLTRKQMIFDYELISNLTKKEIEHIVKNIDQYKNLIQCVSDLLNIVNVRRKKSIDSLLESLKQPAYSLEDSISWIADSENQLLGISISCSKIDECDLSYVNTDCKALHNAKTFRNNIMVGVEIREVSVIKTKRGANPGQEMAFVKIADNTGSIDSIIFPEEYQTFRHLLSVDNTTVMKLEPSKKKDDSMIIKKVWQV